MTDAVTRAEGARAEGSSGPEGAVLSSLVSSSETGETLLRRCPRRGTTVLFDANDPTRFVQAGCDAYVCSWCGPLKARQFAHAMTWVTTQVDRPRFITLTQLPGDYQASRDAVKDLARRMRGAGFRTEWAWTIEAGSKTGMKHAHALQHGDYVPQRALSDLWGRRVDIRTAEPSRAAVAGYIAKGAGPVAKYLTKGAQDGYASWLALNGGRPLKSSRGFFLGLGVRGALKAAREASPTYVPTQWVLADAVAAEVYRDADALPREERAAFIMSRLELVREKA